MPSFPPSNDGLSYVHYDHPFPSNMYNSRYIQHLFPHNPYYQNQPPPPPPQHSQPINHLHLQQQQPVAHKVWIIDCKSCGTFLTNRGMKAVLLLRPNVPLYSSDALPANCSAFTSNPEALKAPTSCRPPVHPSRTCECLTQTLCCHGCGSTIGYMIVIPCTRCTSSTSANNRATNGHRFVFHSSEVVGSERHYIPNEPGVIPWDTVSVSVPANSPPPPPQSVIPLPLRHIYSPLSNVNDYLPTPPLDETELSPVLESSSSSPSPSSSSSSPGRFSSPAYDYGSPTRDHRHERETSYGSPPPLMSIDSSSSSSNDYRNGYGFGMPTEQQIQQPLKGGDIVFWHHLVRHGEIPGVCDDPRARKPGPWKEHEYIQALDGRSTVANSTGGGSGSEDITRKPAPMLVGR